MNVGRILLSAKKPRTFLVGLSVEKIERRLKGRHVFLVIGVGKHRQTWMTGWWFQIFSIFTPIWGRFPI